MTVTGQPDDLSAVTDLSAFRIIQEALTNVIRHAGPATVAVLVEYAGQTLTIEVTDTGCGLPSPAAEAAFAEFLTAGTGTGHGLRGMRERAAAAGGSIETGPLPGHGFRVAARFPLDPPDPPESAQSVPGQCVPAQSGNAEPAPARSAPARPEATRSGPACRQQGSP